MTTEQFISTVVTGEVPQDDGGLTSQTTEVTTTRFVPPAGLEGPQPSAIVFVDTPGFDRAGLELSDRKILEIVAAWLKEQYAAFSFGNITRSDSSRSHY